MYSVHPGAVSTNLSIYLGTGVSVYSVHPGAVSTNLGKDIEKYVPEQVHGALSVAFNWVAKVNP